MLRPQPTFFWENSKRVAFSMPWRDAECSTWKSKEAANLLFCPPLKVHSRVRAVMVSHSPRGAREIQDSTLQILLEKNPLYPAFSSASPQLPYFRPPLVPLTLVHPPGGPRRHRQGPGIVTTLIRPTGIKDFECNAADRGRRRNDKSPNSRVCLRHQTQPRVCIRMCVSPAWAKPPWGCFH